jgi:hypothetical protein
MKHTSLGIMQLVDGRKRFIPNSHQHQVSVLNRFPVGAKMKVTFEEVKREHTQPQHNYHFALCGYISDHTGYTVDEVHDALMKQTFGTKQVTLLGRTTEARESLSKFAAKPVGKVVELINKDLEVCAEMDIHVPTKEELGFLPD